jgi:uncharacterized repeat protein (TIGR03809 family)
MTHRGGAARSRDVIARWQNLAEQRLEYLTALFETGRWRRYYSERELLDDIRDAKAALEAWRELSNSDACLDGTAANMSWLAGSRTALPPSEGLGEPQQRRQPPPVPMAAEPQREIPVDVLAALESQLAVAEETPIAPNPAVPEQTPLAVVDLDAIQERYPLLRDAPKL